METLDRVMNVLFWIWLPLVLLLLISDIIKLLS